jgi:hypothetical protein
MAYQVLGTHSRARFCATQRLISLAVVMVLLAFATAVSQGQNPTTAPRPTNPTVPNPNVPGTLPTPNPNLAFRLDHFVCYLIQPPQFEGHGALSMIDQFNLKPVPFKLTSRELLCNPVSKNQEPIINRQAHLVAYAMEGPASQPRNIPVLVTNQFGANQRYIVLGQNRFLVPTGKVALGPTTAAPPVPPIPERFGHYACYAVKPEGAFPQRDVVLQDQFGRLQGEVYEPAFLCNPAEKFIDGKQAGPVVNQRDHLMCYALKTGFQPRKAIIHNQFETREIEAVRPAFLCVPSIKQVSK